MTITINNQIVDDLPITGKHIQDLAALNGSALVLQTHLILENLLEYFISKVVGFDHLLDNTKLTFSKKLQLAENIGLRHELCIFIRHFNSLRNKYAHQLDYEVSDADILLLTNDLNCCFSSQISNISDSTVVNMEVEITIGSETINRTLNYTHGTATNHQKLLNICLQFLGNKLLSYIKLVKADAEVLNTQSTDRINDFIRNENRYTTSTNP